MPSHQYVSCDQLRERAEYIFPRLEAAEAVEADIVERSDLLHHRVEELEAERLRTTDYHRLVSLRRLQIEGERLIQRYGRQLIEARRRVHQWQHRISLIVMEWRYRHGHYNFSVCGH